MNVETINIILIEDNPSDVELTLYALTKHRFVNKVKVLNDGEEAIAYLSAQCGPGGEACPALILLDLKLPKVDGLEVLRWIRSNEKTRLVPVVVMTSSAEDRDRVDSYKLGVNSYIVKPVEFDNFAKVVSDIGYYWVLINKPPT